jgi:hypothetical protein
VIVHGYIVFDNYRSRFVAFAYGATARIMIPQLLILIGIMVLCAMSVRYEQAATVRWRNTFFFINPTHRYLAQPSWASWIKWRKGSADPIQNQLSAQLLEQLKIYSPTPIDSVVVWCRHPLSTGTITAEDIRSMGQKLKDEAAAQTEKKCNCEPSPARESDSSDPDYRYTSVEVLSSTIKPDVRVWEVEARWSFHCEKAIQDSRTKNSKRK